VERGHLDDTRRARGGPRPAPLATAQARRLEPGTWEAVLRIAIAPAVIERMLREYGAQDVEVSRRARRRLVVRFRVPTATTVPAFVERFCEKVRRL